MKHILVSAFCLTAGSTVAGVDIIETWNGGNVADWTCYDLVNQINRPSAMTVESNALTLTYKAQNMPLPPEQYLLKAPPAFSGNYISNGIMGVSFRLFCEYEAHVQLTFRNDTTAQTWRYLVPVRAGEWQEVVVPVDPDTLRNIDGSGHWGAFRADLENVAWTGIMVTRNSATNGQSYRIDDFRLFGAGTEYAAWISQYSGTGDGVTLPGRDLDGDGLDNYGEWIAGTSAGDAGETFEVDVVTDESDITLRWNSVPERQYQVLRSMALSSGFAQIGGDIDATPPENTFKDLIATNSAAGFYRVKVIKP